MDWAKLKTKYGPLALRVAVLLLTAILGAFAQWLGAPTPAPIVVETVVEKVVPVAAEPHADGWVADPDAVAAIAATLPPNAKLFADTPAGQAVMLDMPKSVYGWKAYEGLFGQPPPIKDQGSVGSCVSFGTNTAVERTLAAEIVRRKGSKSEWSRFTEEATYGGSRVEIGGGRIRGDGSIGAWAADFVTKYGMVPRKAYGATDLSTYSESRCRDWGQRGVPEEFEVVARKYPVKSYVQVKTWEECKKAAAQDYFTAVCSNQGFARSRDENGVARSSGSWAHCMAIDGYHTDDRGREWGHIVNSWAKYFSGPNGWGSPQEDGFWAESSVIDRMLRQGDSWAFSGVTGFPARKPINWDVALPPARRPKRDPFALAAPSSVAW